MLISEINPHSQFVLKDDIQILAVSPSNPTPGKESLANLFLHKKDKEKVLIFSGIIRGMVRLSLKLSDKEIQSLENRSETPLIVFYKTIKIPKIIFERKELGYNKIEKEEIAQDKKFLDFLDKLETVRKIVEKNFKILKF